MSNKSILIWLALIFVLMAFLLFLQRNDCVEKKELIKETKNYTDIEEDETIIIPKHFIGLKRIYRSKK